MDAGQSEPGQLESLWSSIVDNLPPNQRTWLTSSRPLMLAENTAVVAVPNEFTRAQLEGRLRTRIEDTLSDRIGKPVRLAVTVDPALEEKVDTSQEFPSTIDPDTWGDTDLHTPPNASATALADYRPAHRQRDLSTQRHSGPPPSRR